MMEKYFSNPYQMPGEETTGDPYVLRHNGTYYFYKTNFKDGFVCAWKSDNMVDWTDYHVVCDVPEAFGAYAPEVHYINGKFYLVASSRGNGHFMYVADDPFGPFTCITGRFGQRIDGSFFVDDDGTEYFYRAEDGGICYHEMPSNDKVNTRPHVIPESNLDGWTEGPLIWHRDGYYYLTYTGNHLLSRGYRIAYSVSDQSPVSGYVNMKNRTLLLEVEDEFHALGHSSSALAPDMDGAYIIYHNYDLIAQKPYRKVNVDRLFFNGARMYNNTCWWEQEKPEVAAYSWRGAAQLEVTEGIICGAEETAADETFCAAKETVADETFCAAKETTADETFCAAKETTAKKKASVETAAGKQNEKKIAWLPQMPGEEYTAEFNFNLLNGARLYYGWAAIDKESSALSDKMTAAASGEDTGFCFGGIVELTPAGVTVWENGKAAAVAAMPKNTSFTANMTIRLVRRCDGLMKLILNRDQELAVWKSALASGRLGITADKAEADKFFAISPYAFGSSDKAVRKAVPGRFDAVHAQQDVDKTAVTENGMEVFAVQAGAGTSFTYPVNVRRNGTYEVSVLVRGNGEAAFAVQAAAGVKSGCGKSLSEENTLDQSAFEQSASEQNASEQVILRAAPTTLDHDGCCWLNLGEIELKAGFGEVTFTALEPVLIDSFRLSEMEEVQEGVYVTEKELQIPLTTIIGEKGKEAMITKEYGFTCSEQPNFAFWGNRGWTDLAVKGTVHMLKAGDGFAALLLRANKESWFGSQVKDSVDALEVRFDAQGVTVSRLDYERKILGKMVLDFDEAWLEMECSLQKNTLTVKVAGKGAILLEIPDLPSTGRLGVRFDTENFGFGELSVRKI